MDDRVPESVDEAVDILFEMLTCGFGKVVIEMPKQEFITRYHLTLGMYIRNCFKLWHKDSRIIQGLNGVHPDTASAMIMGKLWERFREECPKREDLDELEPPEYLNDMIKIGVDYIDTDDTSR